MVALKQLTKEEFYHFTRQDGLNIVHHRVTGDDKSALMTITLHQLLRMNPKLKIAEIEAEPGQSPIIQFYKYGVPVTCTCVEGSYEEVYKKLRDRPEDLGFVDEKPAVEEKPAGSKKQKKKKKTTKTPRDKPTGSSAGLMERLNSGPVVVAEGYHFELKRRGYLEAGPFVPKVVLDHAEAVKQLHREFMRAGSDVIVAFTSNGHFGKLHDIECEKDLEALNINAIRIAKEVAVDGDALVAGNVCSTGIYEPNDKATWNVVREMYEKQIGWAAREGVDFIIAQNIGYIGEAEIALEVIKKHDLPAVINLYAIDGLASMEVIDLIECVKKLEAQGADVVGLSCGRGPATMLPLLKEIRKAVKCHVSAIPVPYNTTRDCISFLRLKDREDKSAFPLSLESHLLTRQDMGKFAKDAYDIGVNLIGVCCGGAPHHVRHMAEALGRRPPSSKYSADLSLHGNPGVEKEQETKYDKLCRATEK